MHEIAQHESGPAAADRSERDLNWTAHLWTTDLTQGVRHEPPVPFATSRLVTCVAPRFHACMTSNSSAHLDSVVLARDPNQLPHAFAHAFNSSDAAAVEQMYEPDGVFIPAPGEPVTGIARAAANQRFLDLGLPIEVHPRHVYVTGVIALLIPDWTIDGKDDQGQQVHIDGTASDVARRGLDGCWRFIIDNPFGTAAA